MKASKRLEIWIKGEQDCRKNIYDPPVDEKERAIYHESLDWEYENMLVQARWDYEEIIDPGNYL